MPQQPRVRGAGRAGSHPHPRPRRYPRARLGRLGIGWHSATLRTRSGQRSGDSGIRGQLQGCQEQCRTSGSGNAAPPSFAFAGVSLALATLAGCTASPPARQRFNRQSRRRRPPESRTGAEHHTRGSCSIAYLLTTIAAAPGEFVTSIRVELLDVRQLVADFGDAIGAHQRRGRLPIRLPGGIDRAHRTGDNPAATGAQRGTGTWASFLSSSQTATATAAATTTTTTISRARTMWR